MLIKGVDDNAMCWMFSHTLTVPAKSWLWSLKVGNVSFLDLLIIDFDHEFCYAFFQLAFVKQGELKSLADM